MLAIRLPEDIEKRLDALARLTGRTKTHYAREAILDHLNDIENLYRAGKTIARPGGGRKKRPIAPAEQAGPTGTPEAPSFVARWQGRFQPAARPDERYKMLAKKYL
jgi:RHH-type rel operon transcriptional repressor/antitoxin RelB